MILQALKEYADRKGATLGTLGYEMRGIPFLIILNGNGEFVDLQDTREQDGKRLKAKEYEVPQSIGRSGKDSWKTTFILWDHYGYVLGFSPPDEQKSNTNKQHKIFVEKVRTLQEQYPDDIGLKSVRAFVEKDDFSAVFGHPSWPECAKIKGCNLTFKLAGETHLVCQTPTVRAYVTALGRDAESQDDQQGICLITGERSAIVRLHIPVALRGLTKPAPLCAINNDRNNPSSGETPAFASFGKSQGYNFPTSKSAAIAYAKALNSLLKSSSQHMNINNISLVFWAANDCNLENRFFDFFIDDPDRQTQAVESLFRSIENGAYAEDQGRMRFYVLGLSPNAARIAIRFWIVGTVAEMAGRIRQHFEDTRIVHGPRDKDFFSLFRLLVCTASMDKAENILPHLAGDTIRAILEGLPYPQTLLQAAIRRVRAEHEITYPRAALIKACLNRSIRSLNPNTKEELKVSLDPNNTNIGYRLGRLFATLERIQIEAHKGRKLNTTIRSRYYGAASSTPVVVFGTLMNKLSPHHLEKLPEGQKVFFKKTLCQIVDGVDAKISFPPQLPLADQGRFAIGYYHQVQDFFTKNSK